MPLSVRQWTCGACGAGHDRDINAALNIRQQGVLELKAGRAVRLSLWRLAQDGYTARSSWEAGSPVLQGGSSHIVHLFGIKRFDSENIKNTGNC